MMYVTFDDIRQVSVVAKNEMKKFIRGKRLLIYVAIAALFFALTVIVPYLLLDPGEDFKVAVLGFSIASVSMLAAIAAILFASGVIASEFEERTALILFTRPIKKTAIFLGKIIGCLVFEVVVLAGVYLVLILMTYIIVDGGVPILDLLTSLGFAIMYLMAASSVAILLSSVVKKASTSAIIAFFLLFFITGAVTGLLQVFTDIEPWFMFDYVAELMITCVPDFGMTSTINNLESILVSTAWIIVSLILGWIAFIRREF
jgi:ABC-2 type transporter.